SPSQKTCPADASKRLPRGRSWAGSRDPAWAGPRGASPVCRGRRGGSKTSRRPASILLIALAAAVSRARAADEAGEDLGEVVVTAPAPTRRPVPRDPTASATIIDTSSAPTQVETLDEALSDAVGVQVRRFGGLGDFS